ncbi:hypothetical protein [Amycolatopsis sp. cmx-4-61]|uniref:hypothetical protein n=1 Tax=Amycolatopsis sp. cmx-4-61 TaxID=2790937 RepID=UPI0039799860
MQYDEALTHVRDHLTHPQVHRLRHAISLRYGILGDLRAALVTVGADIEITGQIDGMRYATGLTGTVQAIYDDKYADLLLDPRSTEVLATGKGTSSHPGAADVERYQLSGMPLGAFTATGVDEAFADLIGSLLTRATEQQLTELSTARARRTDQLAAELKPGDSVMLADMQRKYLAGLTGTVQAVDPATKQFSLLLDEASTDRLRYHGRNNKIEVPHETKEFLLPLRIAFACALITNTR